MEPWFEKDRLLKPEKNFPKIKSRGAFRVTARRQAPQLF
jgi:hypothetical protein